MKDRITLKVFGLVMAMVFCYAGIVGADSNLVTGVDAASGGSGASVNLNFRITIPGFIYFSVSNANSDWVEFEPTMDDVQNGTTIGATGGGTVDVALISNAGIVRITETNDGGGSGISDGVTEYISWGQIDTTEIGPLVLTPPQLSDSGGNSVDAPLTAGNFTNITTQWTYEYTNPATPPLSGIYEGTATYTAAIP